VIVTGEVQGVSFRYYTKEKAKMLGIKGWIKNLPEGQVEAVFEGLEDKVKEMVEWCKKGPSLSKVNHVRVEFRDYKQEFDEFERR
jgi:acylphosphatase